MYVVEAFRIALSTLAANKLRSALTMLGIIIGVGAVIGMLAIGHGFQRFLSSQFAQFGVGTFYIIPVVESRRVDAATAARLSAADAAALARPGALPGARAVVVEWSDTVTIGANGERLRFPLRAVTPNVFAVQQYRLLAGRLYDESAHARGARVAVIGRSIAARIADTPATAVGQRVTLNGVSFEVIGVLANDAESFGFSSNPAETVFVPYRTGVGRLFQQRTSRTVDVTALAVQVREPAQIEAVMDAAGAILRERHQSNGAEDRFTLINPDVFAQQANAVIGGFNAFLGLVAGVALLVGGIGIMNIMLVSVAERTAEIGLRKALGARRRVIMVQFLIEALLLALLGSALGILLGYGLAAAGTFVLVSVFVAEGAQATVTIEAVALSAGIAGLIGLLFGLLPAMRAARLNPIEALRSE